MIDNAWINTNPTNDELRRKIAELRGYKRMYGFMDQASSQEHEYWITPDGFKTVILPNYPFEIADAWGLVEEAGLSVMKTDNGYLAGRFDLDQEYLDVEEGIIDGHLSRGYSAADTAPRAISMAYIRWKEKQ